MRSLILSIKHTIGSLRPPQPPPPPHHPAPRPLPLSLEHLGSATELVYLRNYQLKWGIICIGGEARLMGPSQAMPTRLPLCNPAPLRLFVTNLKSWSPNEDERPALLLMSRRLRPGPRFIRNIITNMSQVFAFNMCQAPRRNVSTRNYAPQGSHSCAVRIIY